MVTTQGTCTGGQIVRCSLGTMASGGRAVVTIVGYAAYLAASAFLAVRTR